MEIQCVVGAVGRFPGVNCSSYRQPLLSFEYKCEYTPFVAEFIFNGGSCSQSDNQALLNFTCSDSAFGSPPIEEGAMSYIVVADAVGKGFEYYAGWVRVGTNFQIESPDNYVLDDGFRILIYDTNQTENYDSVLQEVVYEQPLCSFPLE
jgi:hypothetical protein